uniref:Ig-like domain-containing protein n=2 Tax=Esox lucius TaxID=8010 RepID=A0A6Q2XL88_ESOLU
MKTPMIFFVLASVVYTEGKFLHIDLSIDGCSDSDRVNTIGEDGDELWFADFNKHQGVGALPPFADPISFQGLYERAVSSQQICKHNLVVDSKAFNKPEEKIVPPHSSIYHRDDVILGLENTLICHVSGFHPPPVRIRWTRNNQNVTEGIRISNPYPNQDFSYSQFSSLTFTPEEGDIYSCTVDHKGISEPQTRIWEPEGTHPSVGPTVFCGVGLTLGLLGVATGTFFLIKGNR